MQVFTQTTSLTEDSDQLRTMTNGHGHDKGKAAENQKQCWGGCLVYTFSSLKLEKLGFKCQLCLLLAV